MKGDVRKLAPNLSVNTGRLQAAACLGWSVEYLIIGLSGRPSFRSSVTTTGQDLPFVQSPDRLPIGHLRRSGGRVPQTVKPLGR